MARKTKTNEKKSFIKKLDLKNKFLSIKFLKSFFTLVKNFINRVKTFKKASTRKEFHLQTDPQVFRSSLFVLIYRTAVYLIFIIALIIFREDIVYLSDSFLNLFHLKRIFRLETFNAFLLLKIINFGVIFFAALTVLAMSAAIIRWAGLRVLICEDEFIFEEKTFLFTRINRIPFVSVSNIKMEANTIQELFGFGKVTVISASENGNLEIKGICSPGKVISSLLDKTKLLKEKALSK